MSTHSIIAGLVTITALSSYINHKFIKLDNSIGLTLITFLLTSSLYLVAIFGLDLVTPFQDLLSQVQFTDTFLNGMLSYLLFAVSLHVNVIELRNQKWVILLMATLGVLLSTLIVGTGLWAVAALFGISMPLGYCMVFGALISPTDPIAVLGTMKKLKTPKSLEVQIAGEALFNDGMGIVLFICMLAFATGQSQDWPLSKIGMFFVQQGLGGVLFGLFLGYVATMLLKGVDNYEVAVLITLSVVTGGYTCAHDYLDVSGVIAMSVAGLVIGSNLKKCGFRKATVAKLDAFWELIDEVLTAILFVLIGLEFVSVAIVPAYVLIGCVAIGVVLAARFLSVVIPIAMLSKFQRFQKGTVSIMTWGGLRGGIAIALALSIPATPERALIVTVTYIVVIFSIVVQGMTIGSLLKKYTPGEKKRAQSTPLLTSKVEAAPKAIQPSVNA